MNWSIPRTFLAVIRHGSLSAAARKLGLAQSTVRRQIEFLETGEGTSLFTRGPEGLMPTPTALKLREIAERMERHAGLALERTRAGTAAPEGEVRVTVAEIYAFERLGPFFACFRARHPGLILAVAARDQPEDLLRGKSDVSLSFARPTRGAIVARRVERVHLGLYAHRNYLRTAGTPTSLADLERFAIIGPATESAGLTSDGGVGLEVPVQDYIFRTDSLVGQLAAIRQGLGVGPTLAWVAEKDPSLRRVLPWVGGVFDVWIAMQENQRDTRRVRLVFDGLADFLTSNPSSLSATDRTH